jgi:hypothetical protein
MFQAGFSHLLLTYTFDERFSKIIYWYSLMEYLTHQSMSPWKQNCRIKRSLLLLDVGDIQARGRIH